VGVADAAIFWMTRRFGGDRPTLKRVLVFLVIGVVLAVAVDALLQVISRQVMTRQRSRADVPGRTLPGATAPGRFPPDSRCADCSPASRFSTTS